PALHVSSHACAANVSLHSFPTRRSSDLGLLGATFCRSRAARPARAGSAPPRAAEISLVQSSSEASARKVATVSWTNSTRGRLARSEEHTSELQSRENLVCRLLLEKKKKA